MSMRFSDYIDRIHKAIKLDEADYPHIICLLERMCEKCNWKNYKKDFECCILYACVILIYEKMYNDDSYENKHYAFIFGIKLWELNDLERKFVDYNDWNFFVSKEEYDETKNEISGYEYKQVIIDTIYESTRKDKKSAKIANNIVNDIIENAIIIYNDFEEKKKIVNNIVESAIIICNDSEEKKKMDEIFVEHSILFFYIIFCQ
ncbi:putative cyclin-like protein [Bodo saltans virus]|uniref:Cyclin-like protein n=1 Tax=Bodo saltans virus TaxID=2024608 RepID=A0A2H4UTL6_9VIRU|nr:putative cyclin-like protein [Bodo saltans virus]ATZ80280.1 putative cyclin-like protein [Bodo saltans virus]